MDSKDLKGLLNLVLVILFIAASLLGPMLERWRRKKEAERRRAEGMPEEPPAPPPPQEGTLTGHPYEEALQEVFGPYIERRRRAAEEARAKREATAEEVVVVPDPDEEIRRMREARRPEEPAYAQAAEPEPVRAPLVSMEEIRASGATSPVPARRPRSLNEILFRNDRFSPEAKLLVAAEIMGRPRSAR